MNLLQQIDNQKIVIKLGILVLIPLGVIIVLSFNSIMDVLQKRSEAQSAQEIVELSIALDKVAHNFALERGISAGFMASRGKKNSNKLKQQRIKADEAASNLQTYTKNNDIKSFGIKTHKDVNQLLEMIKQRNTIRSAVDKLTKNNGAFSFYSNLNAKAIKILEVLIIELKESTLVKMTKTYASLIKLKEYSGQERGALNKVFSSGKVSATQSRTIRTYIAKQDLMYESFTNSASTEYYDRYNSQIKDSSDVDKMLVMREIFLSQDAKTELLSKIQQLIGYGGMIHNFKNYVLRNNIKYKQRIDKQFNQVQILINQYKKLKGVTQEDIQQITQLEQVFNNYRKGAKQVEQLYADDASIHDVDTIVKVDDNPGLDAISFLSGIHGVDAQQWFASSTARIKLIKKTIDAQSSDILSYSTQLKSSINRSLWFKIIILLLIIGVVVSLSYLIVKRMIKHINEIVSVMEDVQTNSNFSQRSQTSGNDEISRIGHSFNRLLDSLQHTIGEVNLTMSAVAKGDFTKRIESKLQGDLDMLKKGVNGSADSVEVTMNALGEVMQALSDGNFKARMSQQVEGEFRHKVDNAIISIDTALSEIAQIMQAMTQGDFTQRINSEFNGELDSLKNNINLSINGLDDAISEISKVAEAQQKGDLNLQVEGNYLGQLGILKDAINSSASNLRQIVTEIRDAANSVSVSSNEISQGNMDLSQRTEEQASSLEETAASLEEINGTVAQSAENSEQSSNEVEKTYEQAKEGGIVVNRAIKAMDKINDSSRQISDIINVIDEIAFQTNLLALNAAVEAARAGEQGRGFAVVAEAVRDLAQRSSNSAKEIKQLIKESVEMVDQGSHLVDNSGQTLEQIIKSVMNVKNMMNEIATSSKEQSSGINQINTAVTHMDEITQQNAALVEQASAASETMAENAAQLLKMVDFFQIGGGQINNTSQTVSPAVNSFQPKNSSKPIVKPQLAKLSQPVKSPLTPSSNTSTNDEWEEF